MASVGFDMNDLSAYLEQVDEGRFANIAKFLGKLTVQDLEFLNEDDFVDLVDYQSRALALVLYRKHVKPLKNSLTPSSLGRPWWFDPNRSLRISLGGRVRPIAKASSASGDLLAVEKLATLLPKDPIPIGFVDLSSNGLANEDLPHILELVKKLATSRAGIVIDLSNNKLGPESAKELTELCDLQKVAYVNICGNVLATESGKAFFEALDDRMLGKVIFVPAEWLTKGAWPELVPGEPRQLIVKSAHENYYGGNK